MLLFLSLRFRIILLLVIPMISSVALVGSDLLLSLISNFLLDVSVFLLSPVS